MNTFIPAARFLALCSFFVAILLPVSAGAQATISVVPTSVSVQANVGTNAPSQIVQVRKSGGGAVKWTVVAPAAAWLTVSPTSGTNNGMLTLTFLTSALAAQAQPYTTSFRVTTPTQSVTVNVSVTIVGSSPPPTLTITCPANITTASPDGSPVVVSHNVTTSGGTSPVTLNVSPPSGSSFPVGTTAVQASAKSSDGQTANCSFTVTVTAPSSGDWTFCALENQFCAFSGTKQVRYGANDTYFFRTFTGGTPCTNEVFGDPIFGTAKHCDISATLPASGVGPQPSITCPAGAVNIFPGDFIPSLISVHPPGTTFCLKSGVHLLDRSITPRTGDTYVGEYGAVLEGTWTTVDDTEAAFRAHNQDIDDLTIRNLKIINLRRGIHGYAPMANRWTIENNEIASNYSGVVFPANSILRNNHIHHNQTGGYQGLFSHNSLLENNEIANNGWEQKVVESANVTFRNNFVHHNDGPGIWYDGNNTTAMIEGNRIEDNGWIGIFFEISGGATIRNNTIKRSWDTGVFISTSKNVDIHNNTLENNFRGITYFLNCPAVGGGTIFFDLENNASHDNLVVITSQSRSGSIATLFSYTGTCTSSQVLPYKNGSKNLTFVDNTYDVVLPDTGQYFYWDGFKFWNEWQALGHDTTGTIK